MIKKIIIGIIAGIISGFFGAGGGMIVVPALVYFLHMDEKVARGTTIFAILPMVITSGIFYVKSNFIDWGIGIKAVVGGIIGGYLGAKLLNKLSNKFLKIFFTAFLIFMAIRMLIG